MNDTNPYASSGTTTLPVPAPRAREPLPLAVAVVVHCLAVLLSVFHIFDPDLDASLTFRAAEFLLHAVFLSLLVLYFQTRLFKVTAVIQIICVFLVTFFLYETMSAGPEDASTLVLFAGGMVSLAFLVGHMLFLLAFWRARDTTYAPWAMIGLAFVQLLIFVQIFVSPLVVDQLGLPERFLELWNDIFPSIEGAMEVVLLGILLLWGHWLRPHVA